MIKRSKAARRKQMLKFYHAPWSRASGVLWLLEELALDYELVHVDIRAEGGVAEDYRKIQPNKKVPAIEHHGVVITERAAICTYLADSFPAAGLAPAIGDSMRGPYLTALVYCELGVRSVHFRSCAWPDIQEQRLLIRSHPRHGFLCGAALDRKRLRRWRSLHGG